MILALDIGGTKTAVGLVKGSRVTKHMVYLTPLLPNAATFTSFLKTILKTHLSPRVHAIGIGIAGQVDPARGIVRTSPNLRLKNFPLRQVVARASTRVVAIDNDAHCFALGEAVAGAGRGKNSVFGITLGTGVGGALVKHKTLVRGTQNTAGEIGHLIIAQGALARRCSCGQRGHLEAYVGGRHMVARYNNTKTKINTFDRIAELCQASDARACALIDEAQNALAVGFANILTILNPDCIVVGGGIGAISSFWKPAATQAKRLVPFSSLRTTPIVPALLKNNATLIGAALLSQIS